MRSQSLGVSRTLLPAFSFDLHHAMGVGAGEKTCRDAFEFPESLKGVSQGVGEIIPFLEGLIECGEKGCDLAVEARVAGDLGLDIELHALMHCCPELVALMGGEVRRAENLINLSVVEMVGLHQHGQGHADHFVDPADRERSFVLLLRGDPRGKDLRKMLRLLRLEPIQFLWAQSGQDCRAFCPVAQVDIERVGKPANVVVDARMKTQEVPEKKIDLLAIRGSKVGEIRSRGRHVCSGALFHRYSPRLHPGACIRTSGVS